MPPILLDGLGAAFLEDLSCLIPKFSFNHFFPPLSSDLLSAAIFFLGAGVVSVFFFALAVFVVALLVLGLLAIFDFWVAVFRF